jgi:3-hydroxy-9,10-secoandrosta-1,3,5(10)-triene-9,17-dione monooxygenase
MMGAIESRTGVATPSSAEEVLKRVNELVPVLRSRARETELARQMLPGTLDDLTRAGVWKLTLPRDAGGYEADPALIAEVLTQIARGCPSTCWIASVIVAVNYWAAVLPDEGADEVLATPDLRISGLIAPTGKATPVEGGFQVSGQWQWNTGGRHSNWIGLACMPTAGADLSPIVTIARADEVEHQDNWDAFGMAGTATNIITAANVFVPDSRVISVPDMANGTYPERRYSGNPYFNRPSVQFFIVLSAPAMLGMARGAMDVFMEKLPGRSITYTSYEKASEAPLTHLQLAKAQFDLEIAEMYTRKLTDLLAEDFGKEVPLLDRIRARAWLGQVVTHAKRCVNQLFEASSGSQILHSAHIQRYFRDVNALSLHALVQHTATDELYGRTLAGLEPNTFLV